MRIKQVVAILVCTLSVPALAEDQNTLLAAELAALREQVAQMKAMYESRIAALEEKLATIGKPGMTNDTAPPPQTASQPMPSEPSQASTTGKPAAFNPETSLILQGAYTSRKDVEGISVGGFAQRKGQGDDDNKRGFNVNETELMLAANIDPYWRGQATLSVLNSEASVEEAWFQTTALGNGMGIKVGRILSGIGYLNEQHAHQWDFYDQPLMYKVLFGGDSYAQDGMQLKWLAPLDTFVELGVEIGRGQNFPGDDRNISGTNSQALFAHVGDDIGISSSWRAGFSWLHTRAGAREGTFETMSQDNVSGTFNGRSRVWIADFVYKWAPDGNPARRNFKLQAEYFRRAENGTLAVDDGGNLYNSLWRTRQSGYYFQGLYQFTPNWRAGLRYDRLSSGSQSLGDNPADIEIINYHPSRFSTMIDYSWSEFSRLRLQWSRDRAMLGVTDNQITLQYIMSLGSHGAHKF
ncbi:MAG: TonB-dependent receptor [Betaproteobacteria bacterium]|nr:TonB-dependent receptor [Betaproteobacteria bacterium]